MTYKYLLNIYLLGVPLWVWGVLSNNADRNICCHGNCSLEGVSMLVSFPVTMTNT